MNREQAQAAIKDRGKIEISLELGRSHQKKWPKTPANSINLSSRPAKVTKKILHDNGKSHFTQ